MSSGQSKLSQQQLGTTNALGAGAQANANTIYGNLQPFYQQEMTNPTATPGYVGANQALGGSLSAAKGGAAEATARTRNQAGYAPALDESVRQAGRQQSENAQNISQAGAVGEAGLYGQNLGEVASMYGLGPSTIKAGQVPTWWQSLLSGAGQLGQGVGAAMTGYGNS